MRIADLLALPVASILEKAAAASFELVENPKTRSATKSAPKAAAQTKTAADQMEVMQLKLEAAELRAQLLSAQAAASGKRALPTIGVIVGKHVFKF